MLSPTDLLALEIVDGKDGCTVSVFAKPRARKSQVVGVRNGRLEVAVAAPPADGEANAELLACLAESLGLPRKGVSLLRGASSKTKQVRFQDVTAQRLRERLSALR